jgi:hypothetical protein
MGFCLSVRASAAQAFFNMVKAMSIRDELRAFMHGRPFNYFITFNFGYEVRPGDGQPNVGRFFNHIQERTYGRRWQKLTGDKRVESVGFWEHVGVPGLSAHLHTATYIPSRVTGALVWGGPRYWVTLAPRGQLDVQCAFDCDRIDNYITKKVHWQNDQDRMFVYSRPSSGDERPNLK